MNNYLYKIRKTYPKLKYTYYDTSYGTPFCDITGKINDKYVILSVCTNGQFNGLWEWHPLRRQFSKTQHTIDTSVLEYMRECGIEE